MIERSWLEYSVVLQSDHPLCIEICPDSDTSLSSDEHLSQHGLQVAENLLFIRNSSWHRKIFLWQRKTISLVLIQKHFCSKQFQFISFFWKICLWTVVTVTMKLCRNTQKSAYKAEMINFSWIFHRKRKQQRRTSRVQAGVQNTSQRTHAAPHVTASQGTIQIMGGHRNPLNLQFKSWNAHG